MRKRKQSINTIKNGKLISRIRLFLIAALTVIIFYPPYLQGLFFEKHVLPTQIFVFIVFIIFLIYKCLKKDYTFLKTPIEYAALGFVIVYFISIFVAVHTRSAIIEWLKYCMYFAVFYMISDLADNLKTKLIFLWAIVISAVGISIIGLDAAMGGNIVGILNKFFRALGVQGDIFFGLFVGNRIHSTLQYPNALASYLMAVFFVTVGLIVICKKLWQKAILSAFSFILFVTFMLTQSRGAQLLFPVAVIILIIVSPKNNRIKSVTNVLLLAVPAVVISLLINPYLSAETLNEKAPLLVVLGMLITAITGIAAKYIGNLFQRVNWKIYVGIIAVLIIAFGIAASHVINSSVPSELSLENSDENKTISISKDVALKPNKEYILRFEAEGKMKEEKPYAFFVRIFSNNENNILFGGSTQLLRENYSETNGEEQFDIEFTTTEDTKLINVNFTIHHAGTSVKINSASIIDAETGKAVKNIILKNKYNLDSIISRFQNIWLQESLVSRIIFYKDGLNIFKDRWFLGAGGGAWNYLYRRYQSYNYASSQAHNYPLQLGIETGVIGLIILIGLIVAILYTYIRYNKKTVGQNEITLEQSVDDEKLIGRFLNASIITAIAALLMHAVIDFDFSESAILLLLWQLIALHNRELKDNLEVEELKLFSKEKHVAKRNKYNVNNTCKMPIILGFVISAITLYFSSTFLISSSFAKQSFEALQNNEIETAINKMEKAVTLDRYNEKYIIGYNPMPNRPDIKAGLTDILFMKNDMFKKAQENEESISENDISLFQRQFAEAAAYVKNIEKKADNNLSLTSDLASYCFKTGEIDKGINYLNSAINYFPFEPSLWNSKVDVYYQLMRQYFNNEEYEKAEEYLSKALSVIDEAKNINTRNMNPFVFNRNTVELLQTMKFMEDNWNINALYDVNEVVHYSMLDLDVNSDSVPDQWGIIDKEILDASINDNNLVCKTEENTYIYTNHYIYLEKGKSYQIEVQLKDNVDYLSYYFSGITQYAIPLNQEGNKYTAEILIDKEPSNIGNQFRIFLESDCEIECVLIKEKS